jgi:hypothetical protein
MIENPQVGRIYRFTPGNNGGPISVVVKGFRLGWVECDGVDDGKHRSCSRKRLSELGVDNPPPRQKLPRRTRTPRSSPV